jgi:hypothetical protein
MIDKTVKLLALAVLAGAVVAWVRGPAGADAGSAAAGGRPDLGGVWALAQPVNALTTVEGQAPPLTADAQKAYQERLAATARGDRSWDTTLKCKPPGEPRSLLENGWPFQIGQADDRVVFMFQWNRYIRVIDMGLELPDFAGPFFYGKSSGTWDGDTLVATLIGPREETALDSSGLPHSEDLKLTERFRLIDGGRRLEARLHFEDPATFTAPWDARLVFERRPDDAIAEDHCLDRLQLPNSYRPKLDAAAAAAAPPK